MALKAAGVKRCRMGDFEVEFHPEVEEAEGIKPVIVEIARPNRTPITGDGAPQRPGYASLFPKAPGFTPADAE